MESEFLKLADELTELEDFDKWSLQEYVTLAYVLDKAAKNADYSLKAENWHQLVKAGKLNEFAWSIAQETWKECNQDALFASFEKTELEKAFCACKEKYEKGQLKSFALVKRMFAPKWFAGAFERFIREEEMKMESTMLSYMVMEEKMSQENAKENYDELYQHYDILMELFYYVRNKKFPVKDPVMIAGYTAEKLKDSTYLSVLGVYNFLVYLREDPKEALKDLKEGLPRK